LFVTTKAREQALDRSIQSGCPEGIVLGMLDDSVEHIFEVRSSQAFQRYLYGEWAAQIQPRKGRSAATRQTEDSLKTAARAVSDQR
jgi:hypothetical protein